MNCTIQGSGKEELKDMKAMEKQLLHEVRKQNIGNGVPPTSSEVGTMGLEDTMA